MFLFPVPGLLLAAALAGLLGDVLTTLIFLRRSGLREGNPAMRWLMGRIGALPAMLITHGALAALAIWLWRHAVSLPLAVLALLFGAAALWNLWIMGRHQ